MSFLSQKYLSLVLIQLHQYRYFTISHQPLTTSITRRCKYYFRQGLCMNAITDILLSHWSKPLSQSLFTLSLLAIELRGGDPGETMWLVAMITSSWVLFESNRHRYSSTLAVHRRSLIQVSRRSNPNCWLGHLTTLRIPQPQFQAVTFRELHRRRQGAQLD